MNTCPLCNSLPSIQIHAPQTPPPELERGVRVSACPCPVPIGETLGTVFTYTFANERLGNVWNSPAGSREVTDTLSIKDSIILVPVWQNFDSSLIMSLTKSTR